jgi:hypothetical protein
MKCPVHTERDVVGYCIDCGAFGCDQCLVASGGGENLCPECQKKKEASSRQGRQGFVSKLFGEKETAKSRGGGTAFKRSSVARQKRTGRKLEVYFRDGKIIKGSTYKLDTDSIGFHLVPIEPVDGKDRIQVNFSDLKAIHVVDDFDGQSDASEQGRELSADGEEVRVAFRDGETIEGHTLHRFNPACHRFFIAPKGIASGSISILVERSALNGIEMEGFREGVFAASEEGGEADKAGKKATGRAPLSQNESMGDLYFSMKNYDSALEEYEKVRAEFAHDKRLNMKISVCNFNRGVNFVKSRKYTDAKIEFDKIGEDDPIYDKARRKIRKIEKILKEADKIGG